MVFLGIVTRGWVRIIKRDATNVNNAKHNTRDNRTKAHIKGKEFVNTEESNKTKPVCLIVYKVCKVKKKCVPLKKHIIKAHIITRKIRRF